jgi:hypothetical protein
MMPSPRNPSFAIVALLYATRCPNCPQSTWQAASLAALRVVP